MAENVMNDSFWVTEWS